MIFYVKSNTITSFHTLTDCDIVCSKNNESYSEFNKCYKRYAKSKGVADVPGHQVLSGYISAC